MSGKNPLFRARQGLRIKGDSSGIPGEFVSGPDALQIGVTGTVERVVLTSGTLSDNVRNERYDQSLAFRHTGSVAGWFSGTFVANPNHELTALNCFNSGSAPLEFTGVPASGNLYYSKVQRLQTLTVKKTASFFDTVVPYSGVMVPVSFAAGTGSLITIVTGSNTPSLSCSYRYPATIRVDVPQSGRLVDLRVWVEIIHLSGGAGKKHPLSTLGIALRSPNVRWGGHAHPVRNDPLFIDAFKNPNFVTIMILGSTDMEDLYFPVANFYRDSFLLWEGAGICQEGADFRGPQDAMVFTPQATFLPVWDRDRSMRTIFCDGASVNNPRHLGSGSPSGSNYIGSPNASQGINHSFGMNVPWTSDKTVFPATESYQANGSPPKGWLTAPGGVAGPNEWPTTGVNYGAEEIKPVYPLLEGIYQRKSIGSEFPLVGTIVKNAGGIDIPQEDPAAWNGFRPGLKGTEISGTWEILFAQAGKVGSFASNESNRIDAYFRQVRLEFVYERWNEPIARRSSTSLAQRRSGEWVYSRISGSGDMGRDDGSGSWDGYVSRNIATVPLQSEIGRSFGISLNTGSNFVADSALFVKLSGALADVSGSAPGWLLNNRWGVPVIPASSASLITYVAPTGSRPSVLDALQQTVAAASITLAQTATDTNPLKTRATIAAEIASGSAI